MPALMEAYRLTWVLPTIRTVAAEAFCSWSACRISSRSRALATSGLTSYGSDGTANIMCSRLAA